MDKYELGPTSQQTSINVKYDSCVETGGEREEKQDYIWR